MLKHLLDNFPLRQDTLKGGLVEVPANTRQISVPLPGDLTLLHVGLLSREPNHLTLSLLGRRSAHLTTLLYAEMDLRVRPTDTPFRLMWSMGLVSRTVIQEFEDSLNSPPMQRFSPAEPDVDSDEDRINIFGAQRNLARCLVRVQDDLTKPATHLLNIVCLY